MHNNHLWSHENPYTMEKIDFNMTWNQFFCQIDLLTNLLTFLARNSYSFGRFDVGCKPALIVSVKQISCSLPSTSSKLVERQFSSGLSWKKQIYSLACQILRPHTTRLLIVVNFKSSRLQKSSWNKRRANCFNPSFLSINKIRSNSSCNCFCYYKI